MISCPLCKNNHTRLIFSDKGTKIYSCVNCTNAFTFPPPVTPEYESMDFHSKEVIDLNTPLANIDELHPTWQKAIRKQVDLISSFPMKNILEIGCGEGILLSELKKREFAVFGIEPSTTAAARAMKRDIPILNGYFPSVNFSDKKFDLVILSHVLEHIEDPIEFISALKKSLSPNGRVLFVNTNYKGLLPVLFKKKWYAWEVEQHYWHFTPKGLVKILKPLGFAPEKLEYSSLISHIPLIPGLVAKLLPGQQDQFHLVMINRNDQ
jgi:SAM-dependent methyltransferase